MIFLWIIAAVLLISLIVKRADIVARAAHLHYARGNMQKAIDTFAFATKIGNMNVTYRVAHAYLNLRLGNIDEASKILTLVTMDAKKSADKNRAKAMLALVAWKRGDLDDAIEILETLIVDYRNSNVYQNLGLMYVLKGDASRAVEFNLEAYEYNDSDKIIVDNLAESYVLNGELEKAREMYEKLFTMSPHFPEAFYGYGKLLILQGERERGLELIRESLDKTFSFLSVLTREEVERELKRIEA